MRVVNLVWRHLATLDGALPWAWAAVRPLYIHGTVDMAAVRFRQQMVLPSLGSLSGPEPASVDAVLTSYDHSNTVNLLALGALAAWLRGETAAQGRPEQGARLAAPDVVLPKLVSEADVASEVWQRVLRLNRFGDRPEPLILASMYRHLAHAPAFLQRLETALTPAQADGSLERSIAINRDAARQRARVMARMISVRGQRRLQRSRRRFPPSSIMPSARWSPSAGRSALRGPKPAWPNRRNVIGCGRLCRLNRVRVREPPAARKDAP